MIVGYLFVYVERKVYLCGEVVVVRQYEASVIAFIQ